MKQKAYASIDDNKDNMLKLWQTMVNIECGPGCKEGVDEIGIMLADFFTKLGGKCRFHEFAGAGNMLVSEFGDCSKPFIILTGHMDTVFKHGTAAERPFKIEDGKAYGPGVLDMKVARGSGNIAQGPAMSREQGQELLLEVMRYTRALAQEGVTLFGVGELGMANTTPAAAIVSVLTGSDAQEVVGIGANLPLAKVGNKVAVVRRAIAVNQPDPNDGLDVLSKVGGFDLLGMTGVMLGAASCGLPVVLDGFLSYAAALAACQIAPEVKPYLIPSHYSAEKGARIALAHLGLEPYLNMGMRLGEGSGAALAMPIVEAACAMYHRMGILAASNIVLPKG